MPRVESVRAPAGLELNLQEETSERRSGQAPCPRPCIRRHAAATQLLYYAVVGDGLADHFERSSTSGSHARLDLLKFQTELEAESHALECGVNVT